MPECAPRSVAVYFLPTSNIQDTQMNRIFVRSTTQSSQKQSSMNSTKDNDTSYMQYASSNAQPISKPKNKTKRQTLLRRDGLDDYNDESNEDNIPLNARVSSSTNLSRDQSTIPSPDRIHELLLERFSEYKASLTSNNITSTTFSTTVGNQTIQTLPTVCCFVTLPNYSTLTILHILSVRVTLVTLSSRPNLRHVQMLFGGVKHACGGRISRDLIRKHASQVLDTLDCILTGQSYGYDLNYLSDEMGIGFRE